MSDKPHIKFPATQTVHTPSGPTNACDKHASAARALFSFMGGHVVSTELMYPTECDNCLNQDKSRTK